MTDDARNDPSANPYGDLPEGYGGVARETESMPQEPAAHERRGVNRPDWRKGPLTPEDIAPSVEEPAPQHWTEREAEMRRERLRQLEEQVEAEAASGAWNRTSTAGWPPKPVIIASPEPARTPPPPPPPPADDSANPAWQLDPTPDPKPSPWPWRRKWLKRIALAGLAFLILCIAWLSIAAPPSKTAQPIAPPRLTLLASNGAEIATNGAIVAAPVKIKDLPAHVPQAFMAIEDRRFYSHLGLDPIGIARAMWNNVKAGSAREGGSTITQQLAKITYLNYERNMGRKLRETLMAFWLEGWLTKDEILERYLSNVYFGDNVYGLRAASLHYFNRKPENLTVPQAAMLAGLVKAPSRLAPTKNIKGAQTRSRLVMNAMVDAGYLSAAKRASLQPAKLDLSNRIDKRTGTYFADWATPQIRDLAEEGYAEQRVKTTLDARLQSIARSVVANAPLGQAQVALVAMRPNGEVVAMVGGKDYAASTFNRATQAKRQPGSTFKLFTYVAALRAGMEPDSLISDRPITTGDYRPKNYGNAYGGDITLTQAFAKSSNVAAVRLYEQVGGEAVLDAARDLGVKSALVNQPSTALGTSTMTLLELTAAYAGVAGNRWPVSPHALPLPEPGLLASLFGKESSFKSGTQRDMQKMLQAVVDGGTGRGARLAIPAYGKTGTSQDSRDALFIGYAGDLVVGVWVGKDDNSPIKGISGGGLPARIWRDFMMQAVKGARPVAAPRPKPQDKPFEFPKMPDIPLDIPVPDVNIPRLPGDLSVEQPSVRVNPEGGLDMETRIGGEKVGVSVDRDGNLSIKPPPLRPPPQQPAQR